MCSNCSGKSIGKIDEHHEDSGMNLTILTAEVLSALSSVATATTMEELQQANAAYIKALGIARNLGYRPHIRAVEGQQLYLDWVAMDEPTSHELRIDLASPDPRTSKGPGRS